MNPRISLFLLPFALAGSVSAQSVSFNLQSLGSPDASFIAFTPVSPTALNISFLPNSANEDFSISGATPSGIDNFQGTVSGSFAVTGIQEVIPNILDTGTVATSPGHTLTISDGLGDTETASLWWNTAQTIFSSGGVEQLDVNSALAPDLSHFTYTGTTGTALQLDFAGITSGTATIAFSFASPPGSLLQLASASSQTTDSFQGQVVAIPELPMTAALMGGLGLLGLTLRRRAQAA